MRWYSSHFCDDNIKLHIFINTRPYYGGGECLTLPGRVQFINYGNRYRSNPNSHTGQIKSKYNERN